MTRKHDRLGTLVMATISFCLMNNNLLANALKSSKSPILSKKDMDEALSQIGDNVLTVIELLSGDGKINQRMGKLLSVYCPYDLRKPEINKALLALLEEDSFLYRRLPEIPVPKRTNTQLKRTS
jgi:hypothetical protein